MAEWQNGAYKIYTFYDDDGKHGKMDTLDCGRGAYVRMCGYFFLQHLRLGFGVGNGSILRVHKVLTIYVT